MWPKRKRLRKLVCYNIKNLYWSSPYKRVSNTTNANSLDIQVENLNRWTSKTTHCPISKVYHFGLLTRVYLWLYIIVRFIISLSWISHLYFILCKNALNVSYSYENMELFSVLRCSIYAASFILSSFNQISGDCYDLDDATLYILHDICIDHVPETHSLFESAAYSLSILPRISNFAVNNRFPDIIRNFLQTSIPG